MTLFRGRYRLAHMSQVLCRDLKAEEVTKHAGKRAMGYSLTVEQHTSRTWSCGYWFIIQSPDSSALSWTAFHTRDELRVFCDAYGIIIEGELTPGSRFHLRLPPRDKPFPLPLTEDT